MAPGAVIENTPESVVYHGGKGTRTRAVLSGENMKPTFDRIPTVDFQDAWSPSLEDRKRVAQEVKKAFTNVGFVYAINHGIDESLQSRVTDTIKEFFAQPEEEKVKIHINNSLAIQGYEPLWETKLDERTKGDLKEAFQMGEDPDEPEQIVPPSLDRSTYPVAPINQWPETPSDFRKVIYEYRRTVDRFARTLVRMTALGLDLEEDYFEDMFDFPIANLRALFYPNQEASAEDTIGIGAHADYSWITVVNQLTDEPALEVLNTNGRWISAPPVKGSVVVNVGDVLERATNGRFVSTIHRVRNISGKERYSLAYFLTPSKTAMIRTLPGCLAEGEEPKYEDVSSGQWSLERLLRARYKHPAYVSAKAKGEV